MSEFKVGDKLLIPAVMWQNDYDEDNDWPLPMPIEKYALGCSIVRILGQSYKLSFDCDGNFVEVNRAFLEKNRQNEGNINDLDIVSAELWEEHHQDVDEDEDGPPPLKSMKVKSKITKKSAASRGRPKVAQEIEPESDDSDCVWETDGDDVVETNEIEEEDDEEDDSLDFGDLDKENPIRVPDFRPGVGGQKRGINQFDNMSPYQIFIKLFMSIVHLVVTCTNAHIEKEETGEITSPGKILVFIAIYLYIGLVRLPNMSYYWYQGDMEGLVH